MEQCEAEHNFEELITLADQAQRMCADDPLPEVLEGRYANLSDRANQARAQLLELQMRLKEWERGIEQAEQRGSVDHAIKLGHEVFTQREEMTDRPEWPTRYVRECGSLLKPALELIARDVNDWIPRQSCNNATQVTAFRNRAERTVKALRELGFPVPAETLDAQARRAIHQVEERQRISLTLAQSDDYPRQPTPTESTPVRVLRDEITHGDALIKAVQTAGAILTEAEIAQRVKAIQARQEKFREALKRRSESLGKLQMTPPDSEDALREARVKASRLREVFAETPDEASISEMVVQIDYLLADIASWPAGDTSPERLDELLNLQVEHQTAALYADLDAKELDPAWSDLSAIYRAVAQERIKAARQRSAAWLQPRLASANVIESFDLPRSITLEQELRAAPSFLGDEDRARAGALLAAVQQRRAMLEERVRRLAVATWQQGFPTLLEIGTLGHHDTERLLREIRTPPSELTQDEQERLAPIAARLVAHLDRLSLDELLQRIAQLARPQQLQLLERLSELLGSDAT